MFIFCVEYFEKKGRSEKTERPDLLHELLALDVLEQCSNFIAHIAKLFRDVRVRGTGGVGTLLNLDGSDDKVHTIEAANTEARSMAMFQCARDGVSESCSILISHKRLTQLQAVKLLLELRIATWCTDMFSLAHCVYVVLLGVCWLNRGIIAKRVYRIDKKLLFI